LVRKWWEDGFLKEIYANKNLNEIMEKELNIPACSEIRRNIRKYQERLMYGLYGGSSQKIIRELIKEGKKGNLQIKHGTQIEFKEKPQIRYKQRKFIVEGRSNSMRR
jgi:hypothetical protein